MDLDWHDKAILMPGLVWFQCRWVSFGIKKGCSPRGCRVGLVLGQCSVCVCGGGDVARKVRVAG